MVWHALSSSLHHLLNFGIGETFDLSQALQAAAKLRAWPMTAFSKRGALADQKPAQVTFLVLIKKHSQVCTPPSFAFLISPVRQEAGITVTTFSKSENVIVSATLPALIPSCCSLSIFWKSSTSSASVSCCCSLQ